MPDPHAPVLPAGCSCGTPGWQALLSCGCWSWCHGQPRIGGYIMCGTMRHQSSYKILRTAPGGNAAEAVPDHQE